MTPALTAPEAFTMADLATIASELTGREIIGTYQASRRGDFAEVNPSLEELLGRPQTMRDVLAKKYGSKVQEKTNY